MTNVFTVLVANLQQLGFFGFILPFILFFAIVYALLLKSKWIENNRIIGVIALVFSFFVVGYGGVSFGNFLTQLFGAGAVVLAGILVIILFLAMAGVDVSKKLGGNNAVIALLVGIGIIIFVSLAGILGANVGSEVVATIFMIVVFGVAIWFIAK